MQKMHSIEPVLFRFDCLDIQDLRYLCSQLQQQISQANALLVKNLRHRDKNLSKLHRNCDIITAILQASSLKRRKFHRT